MDKQLELTKQQNDEDKILIAKVLDKLKFAENRNKIESTDFLDLREQSIIRNILETRNSINYKFFGGYDDSERNIIVFSNNLGFVKQEEINRLLSIIRILLPNNLKGEYEHRIYLGGLMKLGIKREKIGDILVRDDGADIIVKKEIAEYLKNNLKGLTRFQKSKIEIKDIKELIYIKPERQVIKIIVPSMRLDCIVGELARCSRSEANKILESERVFVNFKEEIRSSKNVEEGDYITIRGKGRFRITQILGTTKKGRISLEIEK